MPLIPLHGSIHPQLADPLFSFKKIKQMLNNKILALTLSALILGVDSQATSLATCDSTSPPSRLDGNLLRGPIPSEIGKLPRLQKL